MKQNMFKKAILSFFVLVLLVVLAGCGKTYSVSLSVDGVVTTVTTDKKGNVTLPADPTKDGYEFSGWYLDDKGALLYDGSALSQDATLYAKFIKVLTVTASSEAGGSASVMKNGVSAEHVLEGDALVFTATANEGYAFAGWFANGASSVTSAENPYATTVFADLDLVAHFSTTSYPVTYADLFGTTNPNPASYTITETITLAAPSGRSGYVFTGWTDATGKPITTIGPASHEALALTANWEAVECTTVTASNDAYGSYYLDKTLSQTSWDCGIAYWNDHGYSASSTGAEYDVDGYTGITGSKESGVFYSQNVNGLTVPASADITIVPWAKNTGGVWSFNTVKNNILDFERRNPGYKVIAAVNGSAFDINAKGNFPRQPAGVLISQGNTYSATVDGWGVLGYLNDGSKNSLLMSETSSYTYSDDFVLDIIASDGTVSARFRVPAWNSAAATGATSVWFGTYDTTQTYVPAAVPANAAGMKTYTIGCSDEDVILPNSGDDFYGLGTVKAILEGTNETVPTITLNNAFTIQTTDPLLESALALGMRVRVQREITGDYANANALGTFGTLLVNGVYSGASVPNGRNPRTMVGIREDGTLVFLVVDGRQGASAMYGTDEYETAAILAAYGCIGGYNLDGGGSATMVIRDDAVTGGFRCVNSPSDGNERSDSTCIIIAVKQPSLTLSTSATTQESATIHAVVTDDNGLDCQKVVAKLIETGETKAFDASGDLTFTGLTSATLYHYILYREDASGNRVQLYYSESFKTMKTVPTATRLALTEDANNWIFTVTYDDPDGAIQSMTLLIGTRHGYMKAGVLTLAKSLFTEEVVRSATCEVSYILADGTSSTKITLVIS